LVREFLWFFDLSRIFVLGLIIFGFYQSLSVVSNFIKNVHPFLFKRSPDEFILPETSRENRIHVPFLPDHVVNAFRFIPFAHDGAVRFFRLVTSLSTTTWDVWCRVHGFFLRDESNNDLMGNINPGYHNKKNINKFYT